MSRFLTFSSFCVLMALCLIAASCGGSDTVEIVDAADSSSAEASNAGEAQDSGTQDDETSDDGAESSGSGANDGDESSDDGADSSNSEAANDDEGSADGAVVSGDTATDGDTEEHEQGAPPDVSTGGTDRPSLASLVGPVLDRLDPNSSSSPVDRPISVPAVAGPITFSCGEAATYWFSELRSDLSRDVVVCVPSSGDDFIAIGPSGVEIELVSIGLPDQIVGSMPYGAPYETYTVFNAEDVERRTKIATFENRPPSKQLSAILFQDGVHLVIAGYAGEGVDLTWFAPADSGGSRIVAAVHGVQTVSISDGIELRPVPLGQNEVCVTTADLSRFSISAGAAVCFLGANQRVAVRCEPRTSQRGVVSAVEVSEEFELRLTIEPWEVSSQITSIVRQVSGLEAELLADDRYRIDEPGVWQAEVIWEGPDGLGGTAACPQVVVLPPGENPELLVEPECVSSSAGPSATNGQTRAQTGNTVELTISGLPAGATDVSVAHGDGFSERVFGGESIAVYSWPGQFRPFVSWSIDGSLSVASCGTILVTGDPIDFERCPIAPSSEFDMAPGLESVLVRIGPFDIFQRFDVPVDGELSRSAGPFTFNECWQGDQRWYSLAPNAYVRADQFVPAGSSESATEAPSSDAEFDGGEVMCFGSSPGATQTQAGISIAIGAQVQFTVTNLDASATALVLVHGDGTLEPITDLSDLTALYVWEGLFAPRLQWNLNGAPGDVNCGIYVVTGTPVGWTQCLAADEPTGKYKVADSVTDFVAVRQGPGPEYAGVEIPIVERIPPAESGLIFGRCWRPSGGGTPWWEYNGIGFVSSSLFEPA